VDDQVLFRCLEVQQFEQVARTVGADAQALGRIMVAVDVIEAQGVLPRMRDVVVGQPVPVGRLEYLHHLSVTRLRVAEPQQVEAGVHQNAARTTLPARCYVVGAACWATPGPRGGVRGSTGRSERRRVDLGRYEGSEGVLDSAALVPCGSGRSVFAAHRLRPKTRSPPKRRPVTVGI